MMQLARSRHETLTLSIHEWSNGDCIQPAQVRRAMSIFSCNRYVSAMIAITLCTRVGP
jgi:hypothetical protein